MSLEVIAVVTYGGCEGEHIVDLSLVTRVQVEVTSRLDVQRRHVQLPWLGVSCYVNVYHNNDVTAHCKGRLI